jgi:hypothetical protein
MGDFNEEYGSDPDGMVHLATICNLQDVLDDRTGSSKFATFIGGRKRIDYVLMPAGPANALCLGGYESPSYRFKGDYRGFFLDFDTTKLFGNTTPKLASPASRSVRSNDHPTCARFVEAKYKYLSDHN